MEYQIQSKLSTDPIKKFFQLEKIIEKGKLSFIEVGTALLIIREEKLYKDTFRTFEEYCQERWGFQRNYANRLIASAKVVENLVPIGTKKPTSESQVRPLTHLKPEQQKQAWEKAIETTPEGKITAKHIEKIVDEMEGNESDEPEEIEDTPAVKQLKRYWIIANEDEKEIFLNWIKEE